MFQTTPPFAERIAANVSFLAQHPHVSDKEAEVLQTAPLSLLAQHMRSRSLEDRRRTGLVTIRTAEEVAREEVTAFLDANPPKPFGIGQLVSVRA